MKNDDRDGQTLRIYVACPQCGVQMRVPTASITRDPYRRCKRCFAAPSR